MSHAGRCRPGQARTSAGGVRAPLSAKIAASAVCLVLVTAVVVPSPSGPGAADGSFGALGALSAGSAGPTPAAGLRAGSFSADLIRNREWWLSAVQAPSAWRWSKGKGVTVAVLDTGVDARHPDLTGQIITGEDFTGGARRPGDKYWGHHGSAMAGIIAGHGHGAGMSAGIMGVAPHAKVLSIRVTWENDDPLRSGAEVNRNRDAVAKGIRYAVDNGANIINMSLGGGKLFYNGSPTEENAIRYALSKGIVLIASAGNDGAGLNRKNFPAAYPGVLAVGAVDRSLRPWRDSNRHDYVKVAAPGVEIVSADAGGGYVLGTGTSPSAAIVAGIAALIRSRYPDLTSVQVAEAMAEGATRTASTGATPAVGAGVTDAVKALYAANRISKAANTGRAVAPPQPVPQTEAQASAGGPNLIFVGVLAVGGVLVVVGLVMGLVQRRRRRGYDYDDDYEDQTPWPAQQQPRFPAGTGRHGHEGQDEWASAGDRLPPGTHRPYEPDAPSSWQDGRAATWTHGPDGGQDGVSAGFDEDRYQAGTARGLPSIEPPVVDESWRPARPVRRKPAVFGHPAVPLEEQPTGSFSAVPALPEEQPTGTFKAVPASPDELPTGAFYAVQDGMGDETTRVLTPPPDDHTTGALMPADDHTTAALSPPPESLSEVPTTAFRMVAPADPAPDAPVDIPPAEPADEAPSAPPADHLGDPSGETRADLFTHPDPAPDRALEDPLFAPRGDRLADALSDPLGGPLGERPVAPHSDPLQREPLDEVANARFPDPLGESFDHRVGDPSPGPVSEQPGRRAGEPVDSFSASFGDSLSDPFDAPFNQPSSDALGDPPADDRGRAPLTDDPLHDPLGRRVNDVLSDPLGKRVSDALSDPLGGSLGGSLGDRPARGAADPPGDPLGGAPAGSFPDPLNGSRPPGDPLGDSLGDPLDGPLNGAANDPLGGPVGGLAGRNMDGAHYAPRVDPVEDEGHRLPWR
ncbi:S8 family serine peptidase [Actinomadura alba]|uniref:S8 family serine peptidase n=1 Tax=Actinomadura alba TaxID=406431 RepID=A0ABR7LL62_9ACTN|nr:S8 family serine peptidase [Actinomadura alba]MBC6465605.1 S8 family serine peptidase [Actinomadura alba]